MPPRSVAPARDAAALDRSAEGGRKAVNPDELADLLNDQEVTWWFTDRARQGLSMHREIESAWAGLAGDGRGPEVIPLFGRGTRR